VCGWTGFAIPVATVTGMDLPTLDLGALDVATTETASLVGLGVLALIAVAVLLLVGKLLAKLLIVGLIVVLGIAVYSQRAELSECPRTCSCSFFGYQLEIGASDVEAACQDIVGRVASSVN